MADEPTPLSPEQNARFLAGIMEPYKEHQQEKRRVLALNAGFFEKLSALNAGSIAVAASIILAIVLKSDAPRLAVRPVLHEILIVVALLWGSLLLAIFHNFLGAVIYGQLEVAYSDTDLIIAIGKAGLSMIREQVVIHDATAMQVEDAISKGLSSKLGRLAKAMNFLTPAIPVIGYASMATFFAAYTLVSYYLLKLW
jgi:hypothetical protein